MRYSLSTIFTSSVILKQVFVCHLSLKLGHRTALVLLTPFTTVLPLRYPKGKAVTQNCRVGVCPTECEIKLLPPPSRTPKAHSVHFGEPRVVPLSLRLGHRTALVLLTPFTTVLPLRFPNREGLWEGVKFIDTPKSLREEMDEFWSENK